MLHPLVISQFCFVTAFLLFPNSQIAKQLHVLEIAVYA